MREKTSKAKRTAPKPYRAMTEVELRRATGEFDRPVPPGPTAPPGIEKTLEQLVAEAQLIRDRSDALIKRLRELDSEIQEARALRSDAAAKRRLK